MKTKYIYSILLMGLFAVSAFSSQYVSSPPLVDVVKTPAGSFQDGVVQELPIITWGGDIATIYANGNAINTASGSTFAKADLNFKLVRQDDFKKQLESYLSGRSPYGRGTLGMLNMAAELLSQDARTKPVVLYQLTWSTGGDCLVVKEGINSIKDLKGKTIVLQAYGPHVELLSKVLDDAELTANDVTIKYVKDLTGTDESPGWAFGDDSDVDACFVISPDAFALTSDGTIGTGAEGSIKGARIMFSTRSASRITSDVYWVRSDYYDAHRDEVTKFVHALFTAQEDLSQLVADSNNRRSEYDKMLAASGKILLDSEQATADVKGLYGDCEFVGYVGNVKFFATPTELRRFDVLVGQQQTAFANFGLLSAAVPLSQAGFDYDAMKQGLTQTAIVEAPRFNEKEVAKFVDQNKQTSGSANDGAIFSFEILFSPNQNTYNVDIYKTEFDKVIDLASTYGGAIITVEGHSDPLNYLKKKKANSPELVLTRIRQSAKNLSLNRAIAVRQSLIEYAESMGLFLDPSQFATVGHGIEMPKTGTVNGQPVAPKSEAEWKSNMRVEFRLIPVGDTEASVFELL